MSKEPLKVKCLTYEYKNIKENDVLVIRDYWYHKITFFDVRGIYNAFNFEFVNGERPQLSYIHPSLIANCKTGDVIYYIKNKKRTFRVERAVELDSQEKLLFLDNGNEISSLDSYYFDNYRRIDIDEVRIKKLKNIFKDIAIEKIEDAE